MLQKVIDFKIVQHNSFAGLESSVKEALQKGWVPSGPMIVMNSDVGQAMVKFESA